MKKENISIYIVPTCDFHNSEYLADYFKCREFITGFTGSAGTALVTVTEAYLWTDGRYFIQAAKQLEGTEIRLMKSGEPGVKTITEVLADLAPNNSCLGFDGRTMPYATGRAYAKAFGDKKSIRTDVDLIHRIWNDCPPIPQGPVWILEEKYAGKSAQDKIADIRQEMRDKNCDVHIMSALDDICWTLNIRGNDIEYFPLVLSYMMITPEDAVLYINEQKLAGEGVFAYITGLRVTLKPYNNIYEDIKNLPEDKRVLIDKGEANYEMYSCIPAGAKAISARNPAKLMKCVKNDVEISNIRIAQIKDSVAHVRFMKWLKETVEKGEEVVTEISATDKLDEFRAEMGDFISPSFDAIGAFADHSAIIHYSATPESNATLKPGNVFLTDTGAGFIEGSTDITRAYALGEIDEKTKEHFTLVAMSNLRLADAKFRQGSTGVTLDVLARQPLWERGLDYNHGTGHGVGYLLSIHEGPPAFRWRVIEGETVPLKPGMIITDEPGLYFEGEHGIRLENEVLVRVWEGHPGFMRLEILTYVPFDLDAINPELLSANDRKLLNEYHKMVYNNLFQFLTENERIWLKKYTREV